MAFFSWSKTAASNASADSTINWAEGQPPASVNDSARSMMARLAEYRDDTSGLLTTTGTATAYNLTTNQGLSATPNDGQVIAFTPHTGNGSAATLAADGGGSFALQSSPGVALPSALLVQGTPYSVKFSVSANAWIIFGLTSSLSSAQYNIPVGGLIPYLGTSAPNSNFAFPFGQSVSQATYSVLYALIGGTFGSGGGNFNLPDLRGRSLFGLDNMGGSAANRITVAGGNFDGTLLGNTGGFEKHTLLTSEMPSHNHTDSGHTHQFTYTNPSNNPGGGVAGSLSQIQTSGGVTTVTTQSGTANIGTSGGGGPHTILNPAMVVPFILRII